MKFEFLDKSAFPQTAQVLFDILYGNMSVIAPSGQSRSEDEATWKNAVGEGLKKDARRIVLIKDGDELAGFFQYYVNASAFMMEEVQLKEKYQGKGILRELYRFLMPHIPEETPRVEAFADLRNARSMDILLKMGLLPVSEEGGLCKFRGSLENLKKWLNS
ncbi:MAG: GNAT family N-acetyltransferase [Ruminococcaceae bacterium]|nr:GNAT family N-acetyltransferase [Oscillospiraceae bacterium]